MEDEKVEEGNKPKLNFKEKIIVDAVAAALNKERFVEDIHSETNNSQQNEASGDREQNYNTLLDYVYGELRRGYLLENDEQRYAERREKFYIFMKIPREIEKVNIFCYILNLFRRNDSNEKENVLQPAEICDLLRGIILITVSFLMTYVDTSMLYHIVKSQSVIKLYIFFNMLEIADKLFSSFGQDILDALFWTATEPRGRKREHIGLVPHLIMAVCYVCIPIINFQFVELKSMVFKKFEKNNLFHMSCSDVRERFHYMILLFIVIIQTMKEYNWKEEQFWVLLPDCVLVLIAEVLVDWIKHAFITRFNEISYEVYRDYTISLAYDLASSKLKNAFSDHLDLLSRRMGFIPLPLGALVFRVVNGSVTISGTIGIVSLFVLYLCLVSSKVLNNIVLLGKACDLIEKHRQAQKDKIPPPRQCNSLPSSRHHSVEDLRRAVSQTKSTPHSANQSISSSLADIAAQAEIMRTDMQPNPIFSNSSVSLNSLGINETVFGEEEKDEERDTAVPPDVRWKLGSILKPSKDSIKRRVSLQEKVTVSYDLKS
ncbi:transmembrane anterior posterior transformation protein 1-like [Centruroides sculpturatus]|uniref:transmembrane anterior posterior transformation protein 1-like n=1 Tax=Centruroides sculpturatus TaxID=218467 RepID=UPI000C6DA5AB|nr:transmembrane anterior posterior transformation protein 1-like [Centruroides sculpturatus]